MDVPSKSVPHSLGPFRMAVDVSGAAAAWVALHTVGYALSAHACYPGTTPVDAPIVRDFGTLIGGIALLAAIAALAFTGGALMTWRRAGTLSGAQKFMAGLGLLTSLLFLTGTVFTTSAILLVSPCAPWR